MPGSSGFPRRFFVSLLCVGGLLLSEGTAHAHPGGALPPAYQAYTPLAEDDYVQVWNLNFTGQGYMIELMFMVSNVGPGDRGNGSALIVFDPTGRSHSYTAEHTESSLKAVPGQFGIKTAANEIRLVDGMIQAYAEFPGAKAQVYITPGVSGPLFPDWNLKGKDFFRIGIPVLDGDAMVVLERDGKSITLKGRAVMDTILANALPNHYAKRLYLFRGPGSVLMTGFQDREGGYRLKLFVPGAGGQWKEEDVTGVIESGMETEPFSLYRMPKAMVVQAGRCRYEFQRLDFKGGMYVFESISPFLRWVLRLFFSKPFILNYQGMVTGDCPGREAHPVPLFTSYFILGE